MHTSKGIRTLIAASALAGALALPLNLAAASADLAGAELGKSAEEITAALTEQGYEVRKVETEDGMLEAYALKDGKRYEIYVDGSTGKVTKVEEED